MKKKKRCNHVITAYANTNSDCYVRPVTWQDITADDNLNTIDALDAFNYFCGLDSNWRSEKFGLFFPCCPLCGKKNNVKKFEKVIEDLRNDPEQRAKLEV